MSNGSQIQQTDIGLLQRMHAHAEGLKKSYFAAWEAVWPTAEKREVLGFYAAVRQLLLHPVNGPKLAKCPNLGEALMGAAAMGLNPTFGPLGQAIIMAAGEKAELVIGFKGYEAAWIRDGVVKPGGIFTKIVMPQDEFNDELTTEGQVFRYKQGPEDRDVTKMVCSIAALYLRDGGVKVLRRDRAKFERVRKWAAGRANGKQSPYDSWPEEMALKGAIMEGKRDLPIGSCMMRILEWEAEHSPEPHEKDMGEAHRVDLGATKPITVSAALPESSSVEVIEPTVPREAVPVERQTTKAPSVIADESQLPDWSDEDESRIAEWEMAEGEIPDKAYRVMYASVQRMKGTVAYAALAKRLTELSKRRAKKTEQATENDAPGRGG